MAFNVGGVATTEDNRGKYYIQVFDSGFDCGYVSGVSKTAKSVSITQQGSPKYYATEKACVNDIKYASAFLKGFVFIPRIVQ